MPACGRIRTTPNAIQVSTDQEGRGVRVPPSAAGRYAGKWLAAASAGALVSQFMDDPDGYFGEPVAESYDDPSDPIFQPEAIDPAVSLLAELAGSGRALELAIGTGRIGLPLSQRGVPVHGIEMSRAMLARLRSKPGGEAIDVTIGDMATTRVDGAFTVAYLVCNTINNLTSQEAQVACFRNVAEHLTPGGCFVIETNIPELRQLPPGRTSGAPRQAPGGSSATALTTPLSSTAAITSSSPMGRGST
jgi:SAM-dependent methyltransferase